MIGRAVSPPKWAPWIKLLGVIALFLWGLGAVAMLRPALRTLPGRVRERHWNAVRRQWHRQVCRVLGLRLEIGGAPFPEAGLIVANHVSWLDIVALGSLLEVDFVAKSDVASWPVLGYLAKGSGTLFVQRGDAAHNQAVIEQMVWRLRQGRRLMLFPEGTTTVGDRVLRFHSKLFLPAHLTDMAVQPVALEYRGDAAVVAPFIGDDDFVPHLWRLLQLDRIDLRLCFCRPLSACAQGDLARRARSQVVAALEGAPSLPNRNRTPAVL